MKNDRDRRVEKGCLILIAIPLVAITILIVDLIQSLYPSKSDFVADINDPYDVALAFAYSLPFNEMAEMKSYIIKDKWEFVDRWPEIHKPISKKCHFPWDPDFWGAMMIGGGNASDSSSIGLFYTYRCPEYGYWFDAGLLDLKLIDGRWQIVDWDKICEEKGGLQRCLYSDTFVWRSE